jgi:PTH1 family peptidyl-tRNA hydrolase
MTAIRLIVGLGNPGREHETTRHNVGFLWVDEFARRQELSFKSEARYHGLVARGQLQNHEVLLLKPPTFMNASGRSVVALAQYYKITPAEILVVHDELDLPPGAARLKFGGGHGGHNGLKDVIAHLASKDFWRLRIGIGHPGDRTEVVNYVLNDPRREEREPIEQAMAKSQEIAHMVIEGKTEAAMLKLHTA